MVEKGEADLIDSFCRPLSLAVICKVLGVPAEDRDTVLSFAAPLATSNDASLQAASLGAFSAARDYFLPLLSEMGSEPHGGVIGHLRRECRHGSLSDDELLGLAITLLVAGFVTTLNLIGNSVVALLRRPDAFQHGDSLDEIGMRELLRVEGPARVAANRIALHDVEVAGALIPRGEVVVPVIASANRDGVIFERPDLLDLSRRESRHHLAFGGGIHRCLGASLASMEARVALATLFERTRSVYLTEELAAERASAVRGWRSLHMEFRA